MRPRPMKPHVVHVEAVAEKSLRAAGVVDPVKPPLPMMHSLEGEKRMGTPALMVMAVGAYCRMYGVKEV